jgi:hypothetical protein
LIAFNNRWFISEQSRDDFISLPPKSKTDLYRSMSVLPSIVQRFYPEDQNKEVTKEEYEGMH